MNEAMNVQARPDASVIGGRRSFQILFRALLPAIFLALAGCADQRPAPPLYGPALDTRVVSVGVVSGHENWQAPDVVYVVNFWASWCKPCRDEHADLFDMAQLGVPVVGVNYADRREAALEYLLELGNPYQHIFSDPDRSLAEAWRVEAVPVTFIVDETGQVVFRHDGRIGAEFVDRIVGMYSN